jgi:hypothetical protein
MIQAIETRWNGYRSLRVMNHADDGLKKQIEYLERQIV